MLLGFKETKGSAPPVVVDSGNEATLVLGWGQSGTQKSVPLWKSQEVPTSACVDPHQASARWHPFKWHHDAVAYHPSCKQRMYVHVKYLHVAHMHIHSMHLFVHGRGSKARTPSEHPNPH